MLLRYVSKAFSFSTTNLFLTLSYSFIINFSLFLFIYIYWYFLYYSLFFHLYLSTPNTYISAPPALFLSPRGALIVYSFLSVMSLLSLLLAPAAVRIVLCCHMLNSFAVCAVVKRLDTTNSARASQPASQQVSESAKILLLGATTRLYVGRADRAHRQPAPCCCGRVVYESLVLANLRHFSSRITK